LREFKSFNKKKTIFDINKPQLTLNDEKRNIAVDFSNVNIPLLTQKEVVSKFNEKESLRIEIKEASRQNLNDITFNSLNSITSQNYLERFSKRELESLRPYFNYENFPRNQLNYTPTNYPIQQKLNDQSTNQISPSQQKSISKSNITDQIDVESRLNEYLSRKNLIKFQNEMQTLK